MTWTQAVCENRWRQMYGDHITPILYAGDDLDPCCYCGTPSNIYIRIDPATVPFPREED